MNRIPILFLAANPKGTNPLRLQTEIRDILERVALAEHAQQQVGQIASRLHFEPRLAARPRDLTEALQVCKPQMVHFSGHGTGSSEMLFETSTGQAVAVDKKDLADLFSEFRQQVRCVVLNACQSKEQAEGIANSIDCVVGMNAPIGDEAALSFAAGLYHHLALGNSVGRAFRLARFEMGSQFKQYREVPCLLEREGVKADQVVLLAGPGSPTTMPDDADDKRPTWLQKLEGAPLSITTLREAINAAVPNSLLLDSFLQTYPEIYKQMGHEMQRGTKFLLLFDYQKDLAALKDKFVRFYQSTVAPLEKQV